MKLHTTTQHNIIPRFYGVDLAKENLDYVFKKIQVDCEKKGFVQQLFPYFLSNDHLVDSNV